MAKKVLVSLVAVLISVCALSATTSVSAADPLTNTCAGSAATSTICQSRSDPKKNPITGPDGLLTKAISLLSYIAGTAAVIAVIVGGIMYATASGDSNRASTGRQTVIYALAGLVLIVLARTIVLLIINRV